MQQAIRSPRIHIKLCRYPERFAISLSKEQGAVRLGFRFERPTGQSGQELRISEILKEGALPAHNKRQGALGHWHYAVLPDMRIEAANDVKGDAWEMAEELKRCDHVVLQVRRAEAVLLTQQQVRARLQFLSSVRNQQQQQLRQKQQEMMRARMEGGASREATPASGEQISQDNGLTPGSTYKAAGPLASGEETTTGDTLAAAAMLLAADAQVAKADTGEEPRLF